MIVSIKELPNLVKKLPKVYIFPILTVTLLLILSLLHISGTSTGVYDYMFGEPNSNLLVGQPRTVRSDEWTVTTPFTISQATENYPVRDSDIGAGQDMSLVVDVPYGDWSTFFKPQNLMFFIAPLEFSFAFKWWFLAALLALSVYAFVLLLYPKRYLMASLLAVLFVFNPFIQWWYQAITLLPIAYGLLITVLVIKVLRENKLKRSLLYSLLLTYLLICFSLLMYPAFQISVLLVLLVTTIVILYSNKQLYLLIKKRNLWLIAGVLLTTALLVGAFLYQHLDTIKATLSTLYPGARSITSGGFNPIKLITWPFSYLLLHNETANIFNNNQSEISNFMLFGFASLPIFALLWIRDKDKAFTKLERSLLICLIVVAVIIFCRMFIPIGDPIYNLLGLSKVPHVRLFIALGLINLIFIIIAMGRKHKTLRTYSQILDRYHMIVFGIYLISFDLLIAYLKHHFVLSTVGIFEATAVSILLAVAMTLLLSNYSRPRYIGLMLLCLFSLFSAGLANPLYRGLSLPTNPLVEYIQKQEKHDSNYWISNDQPYLSSAILSSGAELYGGVNTYPQLSVWEKYFPNDEYVYNRYAHIRFKIDQSSERASLSLLQADSFRITLSSCDPLLKELSIGYIVSDIDLGDNLDCYPAKYSSKFNKKPLFIYSR